LEDDSAAPKGGGNTNPFQRSGDPIMETQFKPEEVQETPIHSTIVHPSDGQPPVHRVTTISPAPDGGHEGTLPHAAASKGLAQMFGLDIRAAILAVLVDLMVFTGDVASLGSLLPFSLCVAGALGFITYKIQRRWYGDDHDSALIKAMIIGLLTAIPVPLTPLIAIPSGMVGIVKAIRRK
jgi:hypothetical protein